MRASFRFLLLFTTAALPLAACGRGEAGTEALGDTTAAAAPRSPFGSTGADIVRVVPVEVEVIDLPQGWNGMRIAALSDFHLGMWPDNANVARAAVERAIAERPDLIVLLGDYVGRGRDFAALERVLAPLRGRTVFAVMGNEDMQEDPDEPDSMAILTRQALQRSGVQLLYNQRVRFVRGNDTAYIAGVDPYVARRPDWRRAEIYGGIPGGGGATPVLLAHMPVAAATVPTDKYPAVIAGHTFCGQLEVPGTPRLSWVNTELFPQPTDVATNRIYRVRGSTLFVTCGVGFSFVPVRFGTPPEVALITLRAVGGTAVKRDSATANVVNVDSLIQSFTPDSVKSDTTDDGQP